MNRVRLIAPFLGLVIFASPVAAQPAPAQQPPPPERQMHMDRGTMHHDMDRDMVRRCMRMNHRQMTRNGRCRALMRSEHPAYYRHGRIHHRRMMERRLRQQHH